MTETTQKYKKLVLAELKTLKVCPTCTKEFIKTGKKSGLGSYCPKCRSALNKKYWTENCDSIRAAIKIKHKNDPIPRLIVSARKRAKKIGVQFDINKNDLIVPTHCPVLGIEIKVATHGYAGYFSPSVDRIDNDLGYVKGNVRVISHRANRLKSDFSIEELKLLLKDMENARI